VEYELRQQVIEPRRHTFQHLIDRYGDKPASRYDEGTIDVQPTENFHYRPLWDPEHELYDEAYSALRLDDPYTYRDPRQYYYATYVTARAAMHDAFGKTVDYLGQRDLLIRMPQEWQQLLGHLVLPLRHYESGGQLLSVNGARFAYGTTVEQCLTYAAFDRIGNAQMLSRVGITLGAGTAELLASAKESWLKEPALQGLRRLIEELLIEEDWATQTLGLDLADRLLYPLLYTHLDEAALLGGAGAYSLVAQHFSGWFTDHRRWIDALIGAWVKDPVHGEANVRQLDAVIARWLPQAQAAVADYAAAIDALVGAGAADAVARTTAELTEALTGAGLTVEDKA
jgi:phenol hydroxylase P1 protein